MAAFLFGREGALRCPRPGGVEVAIPHAGWQDPLLERFKKNCSHLGRAGILPHPGPLPLGEGENSPAFRHVHG